MAASGGDWGCNEQPKRREGATAAAAAGGIHRVQEAEALVDPILRAETSRGKRSEVETLEFRLKALFPCQRLSPHFQTPDSTPFRFLTI